MALWSSAGMLGGRKWWDLVSNCEGLRQVVIRVERDDDLMRGMHEQLVLFYADLMQVVEKIK